MIYKKIQLYDDREDVTLTTYVYDDSVEMLNGKKRGAVLICPGGAYLYCSDREGEPMAMAFAAMGYHTFVLRYSVYNENVKLTNNDKIVPDLEDWKEKEQVYYPAQMRDLAKALLCIKEHSDEWLVDMDKVAIAGFSAGAHNCAMYAANYDKPVITDWVGKEQKTVRPAAVILGYMLSDYTTFLGADYTKTVPLAAAGTKAYMGETVMTNRSLAEKASPYLQVTDSMPPVFLWATSQDQMVDVSHSLKMASALSEHHVPFELHIFEKGQHGMALGNYATAGGPQHLDPRIEEWTSMVDKWLRERMAPEFPAEYQGF